MSNTDRRFVGTDGHDVEIPPPSTGGLLLTINGHPRTLRAITIHAPNGMLPRLEVNVDGWIGKGATFDEALLKAARSAEVGMGGDT